MTNKKFDALMRKVYRTITAVTEGELDKVQDFRRAKDAVYRFVNRCDEPGSIREEMLNKLESYSEAEAVTRGERVRDALRKVEHAKLVQAVRESKPRAGTYEFELEIMKGCK